MYLILPKKEASERNIQAAIDAGWTVPNGKIWSEIELTDGNIALDVNDGEGLTDDDLPNCRISIAGRIKDNEM